MATFFPEIRSKQKPPAGTALIESTLTSFDNNKGGLILCVPFLEGTPGTGEGSGARAFDYSPVGMKSFTGPLVTPAQAGFALSTTNSLLSGFMTGDIGSALYLNSADVIVPGGVASQISEALFLAPRRLLVSTASQMTVIAKFTYLDDPGSNGPALFWACGNRDSENFSLQLCLQDPSEGLSFIAEAAVVSTFVPNTVGKWYTVGASYNGLTATGQCNFMMNGQFQTANGTKGVAGDTLNDNYHEIGYFTGNAGTAGNVIGWDGLIEFCYVWNRILTPAEMLSVYENPYGIFAVPSTRRWFLPPSVSGNTPFTKSLSGSLASGGVLTKAISRGMTGSLTSGGALTKATAATKTGSVTSGGALVRACSKTLAGATTTAGSLARAVAKPLTGAITSGGVLTKAVAKTFADSLTSNGAFVKGQAFVKSLTGAVTSTGALAKSCGKSLAGTLTSGGTLTRACAKGMAGSLTSGGALKRACSKALAGSTTSTGSLVRTCAKTLTGAVSSGGSLLRAIAKLLTGSLGSSGVFTKTGGTPISPIVVVPFTLSRTNDQPFALLRTNDVGYDLANTALVGFFISGGVGPGSTVPTDVIYDTQGNPIFDTLGLFIEDTESA